MPGAPPAQPPGRPAAQPSRPPRRFPPPLVTHSRGRAHADTVCRRRARPARSTSAVGATLRRRERRPDAGSTLVRTWPVLRCPGALPEQVGGVLSLALAPQGLAPKTARQEREEDERELEANNVIARAQQERERDATAAPAASERRAGREDQARRRARDRVVGGARAEVAAPAEQPRARRRQASEADEGGAPPPFVDTMPQRVQTPSRPQQQQQQVYYAADGEQCGPVSLDEFVQELACGAVEVGASLRYSCARGVPCKHGPECAQFCCKQRPRRRWRQAAGGRRQAAGSRRQAVGGRRQQQPVQRPPPRRDTVLGDRGGPSARAANAAACGRSTRASGPAAWTRGRRSLSACATSRTRC